jgi:GNAT superfamily N-acetyltransferase
MNSNYETVKYSPEFRDQVVRLQTHLWSPDLATNAAYLEWKYEHNPYIAKPLIYLVLCAGKLVGMIGMYGAKWQLGHPTQTFLGLCAGDLVVAPDHRNRGLFTMLMKAALFDLAASGHTYVFALSAGPISRVGLLMMGWRSAGSLQTMYCRPISHPMPPPASKRPIFSSSEEPAPFYFLDTNYARRHREIISYVRVEQTPAPEEMAALIQRIDNDGRMRHLRDPNYFTWRFNNPLCLYRFLFWKHTTLEGYLVLQKPFNTDKDTVHVVDWEATNAHVRAALLEAAIEWGNFPELRIWSATLSESATALLKNANFRLLAEKTSVTHHRPTVLVKAVRDELLTSNWSFANRRLLDLDNWDLRMIYSDGY